MHKYDYLIKRLFGKYIDLAGLIEDRAMIVSDPTTALSWTDSLKNSPLGFAVKWTLLPGALIAGLLAMTVAVLDAPPNAWEREVEFAQNLAEGLEGIIYRRRVDPNESDDLAKDRLSAETHERIEEGHKALDREVSEMGREEIENGLSPVWGLSGSSLTQAMAKLSDEELDELIKAALGRLSQDTTSEIEKDMLLEIAVVRSNEVVKRRGKQLEETFGPFLTDARIVVANQRALERSEKLVNRYWPLILGLSLILNAWLFGKLLTKMSVGTPLNTKLEEVYLYTVTAYLAPTVILMMVSEAALDLLDRYELWIIYAVLTYAIALMSLWMLYRLKAVSRAIADIGNGSVSASAIANRLVISNVVVGLVTFLAVGGMSMLAFRYFILHNE